MSRAWDYLERLTRHPHRGSATAEERAAAREIASWLTGMGYRCETETFRTPRDTLYLGPAAVMAGVALALVLGWFWPWAGILTAVLFMAPLVGEVLGSSRLDLDLLLPRYPSQNVVARQESPALYGTGHPPVRTVVVSAHYDTQRATYLFHPRFVSHLKGYFTLMYGLAFAVPVVLALRWIFPALAWPGWLMAADGLLLLANIGFLLLARARGGYINGANDNGTGTALALSLAEYFAHTPLTGIRLIFLLTGAEEVGTRGMKAFLRRHRFDPATTRFVNLDNLGGGKLHYLTGEGMLGYQPYGKEMLATVSTLAREHEGDVLPKPNLLLPTDALIPALQGYEAVSFLAFCADGSLPNYHWYTDTLERVDRELLDFTESFLIRYVQMLAHAPQVVGR